MGFGSEFVSSFLIAYDPFSHFTFVLRPSHGVDEFLCSRLVHVGQDQIDFFNYV